MATEAETKFKNHNWNNDSQWEDYLKRIEIPNGNDAVMMQKVKRKYFQKYIVCL